jgi:GTP-binding protein EngB required for normal cell division
MHSLYTTKTSIAKKVNLVIEQAWSDVDPEIPNTGIKMLHLLVDQLGVDINTIINKRDKLKEKAVEKTLFDSDLVQD